MSRKLLTHLARQPLRLPLRCAHRGPLHPGRYGTGLPRPSMRYTSRAVFASLTCTTPARLKGRATRPPSTGSGRRVSRPLRTTARPQARFARRSLRSEVAAAMLRPTVAVLGGAGVEGEVTAAARQRQAARRRARLPPQLRRVGTAPTSHNGAHYAFVHPQPRPARTRSASGGSHVGASGRIAALEQKAFCSLGAARPRLRSR